MVTLIFWVAGKITSIGRSACAASMFSGTGLFKSSSKWPTHLFRCVWISVIGLFSLSLIGYFGLLYFSNSLFIVSYSCPIFPSLTAFPSVIVRSSTYLLFSYLMLLFCLFASVHLAWGLTAPVVVRLLLNAVYYFLSWILVRVSMEIKYLSW